MKRESTEKESKNERFGKLINKFGVFIKRTKSIFEKLKKRKKRFKIYFLVSIISSFGYWGFILFINLKFGEAFLSFVSNFYIKLIAFCISFSITDLMIYLANWIENKYYNTKEENMMDSYRNWVINSKFGDSYRLLNYLDKGNLTEFINEKDKKYRKELALQPNPQKYINDLRFNKVFPLYNDVIVVLSNKPLYELKNMLSFLEISPKKNWFFALTKSIIFFFIPASAFTTFGSLVKHLGANNKNGLFSRFMDYFGSNRIKTFIFDSSFTVGLFFILIFFFLFMMIFFLVYKDNQFDEPHVRQYLKASIIRAIEIKENKEETESF